MCEYFAWCVYVSHGNVNPGCPRRSEEVIGFPGIAVQKFVSHRVCSGKHTWVF